MKKEPTIDELTECMDGVGAEIADGHDCSPRSVSNATQSRKYTVRYIIPTVSGGGARNMSVAGDNATDAVNACKAAHPNADILGVD